MKTEGQIHKQHEEHPLTVQTWNVLSLSQGNLCKRKYVFAMCAACTANKCPVIFPNKSFVSTSLTAQFQPLNIKRRESSGKHESR